MSAYRFMWHNVLIFIIVAPASATSAGSPASTCSPGVVEGQIMDAADDVTSMLQHSIVPHKVVPASAASKDQATLDKEANAAMQKVLEEAGKGVHESIPISDMSEQSVNNALCKYLQQVMSERIPRSTSEGSVMEGGKSLITVSSWPEGCQLLAGTSPTPVGAEHQVAMITELESLQDKWASLLPGAIAIVPLRNVDSTKGQDLAWQALYQLNSRLYYFDEYSGMHSKDLGLPDLQFVAFLPGNIVLQKADYGTDLKRSKGRFFTLAEAAGTDKIDRVHNYSMIYHRHLDGLPDNRTGMFLEIGLGCTMNYGPGASAKIWPKLLPKMSTHFIELNKPCVDTWMENMLDLGVSKVHVGSQVDPMILAEIDAAALATPGGLQAVIDDGSHECDHIEDSFRLLFPAVTSQGFYFVEDMMFSSWGTGHRQKISSKTQRTDGLPVSLAALLGSAASGIAQDAAYPAETWADNVLTSYGALVDFVECTPGICAFRKK